MKRTFFRFAASLALLPLLSGCVAALIPVAAGGAMFGKDKIDLGGGNDDPRPSEPNVVVEADVSSETKDAALVAEASAPAPSVQAEGAITQFAEAAAAAPAMEVPAMEAPDAPPRLATISELPATASGLPLQKPQEVPEASAAPPPIRSAQFDEAFAPLPATTPAETSPGANRTTPVTPALTPALTPAPTTARAAARNPAPIYGPTDFRAYDALYSYVDSQARRDPVQSARQSALLAAPGTLSPIRTDCSIRPPAVLIDLDPGNAAFDPTIEAQPNPALSQLLASLRAQEVEIFWISELSAIQAGAVRKALVSSGMDPVGRDGLLLMRRIEDRKQMRRKELAETHCLLAIAGDSRADFDELYLYLKDNNAAQPLESLIGAGWFLTPLPLSALTPNPEG